MIGISVGELLYLCLIFVFASVSNASLSVVVCDYNSHSDPLTALVQANHKKYADRHQYAYVSGNNSLVTNRPPHWTKIVLMENLLQKYEWVMWLDGDAVILDTSRSIESIITDFGVLESKTPAKSMVFSGDTNAINTGVLLIRKSRFSLHMLSEVWKIGLVMEKQGRIGMGLDNGAFSIFLAGCTGESSHKDMIRCYEKVDIGWKDRPVPEISNKIRAADPGVYQQMVPEHLLKHLRPVPQIEWNYYDSSAKFIIHFAGLLSKHDAVAGALKQVK